MGSWKQFLQSNAQILFLSTINNNSWVEVSFVSSRDCCEQDQQTEQSMATTSNLLMTSPGMFIPSVSVTSFSPDEGLDAFPVQTPALDPVLKIQVSYSRIL